MNKCVLFLLNGLGIEKPGSYSISIDQCMPKLSRIKETSYYTSAVTSSLEYRDAYQRFFLGDTYQLELKYVKEKVLTNDILQNDKFKAIKDKLQVEGSKFHIFVEPNNTGIVDAVNDFAGKLQLSKTKIYLHLLITQQTINEYNSLLSTIDYIKYHVFNNIDVGFVIGKEFFSNEMTKEELDYAKKLFFYCSAERWADTAKKLNFLKDENVRPCVIPGFCTTNECFFTKDDVIMFFNTNRTSYDKFIDNFYRNWNQVFKIEGTETKISLYSLIQLDTKYPVEYFTENIVYENCFSRLLEKYQKKALIVSKEENIRLVNFLANGLSHINNPNITFMKIIDGYYDDINNIRNIIENSGYDIIIFDYHMDVSKSINHLKEQLSKIDIVIGNIGEIVENKYSFIISSLYGLKKTLPVADYNSELVTINYEMQIPIFFFDYRYPRSKYYLKPGETNDILNTAICCVTDNCDLYSLIRLKGLFNNLKNMKF